MSGLLGLSPYIFCPGAKQAYARGLRGQASDNTSIPMEMLPLSLPRVLAIPERNNGQGGARLDYFCLWEARDRLKLLKDWLHGRAFGEGGVEWTFHLK